MAPSFAVGSGLILLLGINSYYGSLPLSPAMPQSCRALFLLFLLGVGTFTVFTTSFLLVHAGTVHVPSDYPTIQKAINAANVNDIVLVAAGTYHELVSLNKTVHLVGSDRATTILDGQGIGTVVNVTVNAASITGFTVQNAAVDGQAVELFRVKNVNVTGNNIIASPTGARPTGAGVDVFRSNNTLIDGNVFSHNLYGVNVSWSTQNRISNNLMLTADTIGVEVTDAYRNVIVGNSFVSNQDGIDLTDAFSDLNNITRNLFRGASFSGIFFVDRPLGNILVENTFSLDHIGVNMQNVTGNTFYHNSFLRSGFRHLNHVFPNDGKTDVWDNRSLGGPKFGGNYWDDYNGTDPDADGIGDTPYRFPTNSTEQDSYPLMQPFVPVPLALASLKASPKSGTAPFTTSFTADVLGTLKPFVYGWSFGDGSTDNSASPSHTFTTPGNYSVSVTVRDASGATETGKVSVLVIPSPLPTWAVPAVIVLAVGVGVVGLLYYRRRTQRSKNKAATQEAGKGH